MKTIGLCVIVKNEAEVIKKSLQSAFALVDYVLVVDTGSEDGTQTIIRDFLEEKNVKGIVVDEPWRDFAYNRTFALERLREVQDIDYALIMDADDIIVMEAGFDPPAFKSQMRHDLYDVRISHGAMAHHRAQICSNKLPFSFKGVLHEYLETPPMEISRATATGFSIQIGGGGARSRNPQKFQEDAALLERALASETDPFLISRYTFYLAQSYRDCGERERALLNYMKRAELGYWKEEIYISLFEAGNLMAALERPFEEVIATYLRAYGLIPTRAEALHAASLYCRNHGRNAEGKEYAERGIELKVPGVGLFVLPWVYDYGILDEFAINAYWTGAYRESLNASLRLLTSEKLPPTMMKRVAANARFAAEKLPTTMLPNLGRLGAESFVDQHKLLPQRSLRSHLKGIPRVLLAILGKPEAATLPLYLDLIEALEYPKSSIVLHINMLNDVQSTEQILCGWVDRVRDLYAGVEFDRNAAIAEALREHTTFGQQFGILGRIRDASLRRTLEMNCDFCFVVDLNSLVRGNTLRELVALDLPVVAPLLRSIVPEKFYSNYHAEIDASGYYKECDQYFWILNRHLRGIIEVPAVKCSYLIRADVISQLVHEDGSSRHEYVVFSDSARRAGIPQYLDNRQVYGYLAEEGVGDIQNRARSLLRPGEFARSVAPEETSNSGSSFLQAPKDWSVRA